MFKFKRVIALLFIFVFIFAVDVSAATNEVLEVEGVATEVDALQKDFGIISHLVSESSEVSVVELELKDGASVTVPISSRSFSGTAKFSVTQQINKNSYEVTYKVEGSMPFSIVSCKNVKIMENTWLWPSTYKEESIFEYTDGTTLHYGTLGFFQASNDLKKVRLDVDNFKVYTYTNDWQSYGQISGVIYVD